MLTYTIIMLTCDLSWSTCNTITQHHLNRISTLLSRIFTWFCCILIKINASSHYQFKCWHNLSCMNGADAHLPYLFPISLFHFLSKLFDLFYTFLLSEVLKTLNLYAGTQLFHRYKLANVWETIRHDIKQHFCAVWITREWWNVSS